MIQKFLDSLQIAARLVILIDRVHLPHTVRGNMFFQPESLCRPTDILEHGLTRSVLLSAAPTGERVKRPGLRTTVGPLRGFIKIVPFGDWSKFA